MAAGNDVGTVADPERHFHHSAESSVMDIQIGNLNSLWLLAVVAAGLVLTGYAIIARRRAVLRFATARLQNRILPPCSTSRHWMSALLIGGSMTLLCLAMMDIRWGKTWREVPQKGIEVMFVVDVSRSMLAEDRSGNIDAAERLFGEVARAGNPAISSNSRYNLGNCRYTKAVQVAEQDKPAAIGHLRDAVAHYRGALRANSNNPDARANIELAGTMIRKLEQAQTPSEQQTQPKGSDGKQTAADVDVQLSARDAWVGKPVVLQLAINNAADYEQPNIPDIDGCDIRSAGAPSQSSQTTIINGRRSESRSTVIQYLITPRREGKIEIPPISFKVDGSRVTTEKLHFVATKSETGNLLFVEVEGGKDKVFVGQPLELTLKIWIKPFQDAEKNITLSEADMWQMVSEQTSWGSFLDRTKELATNNQRPGGRSPISQMMGDDFFSSPFGNRLAVTSTRPITGDANVAATEVLPVPTEGRPADYRGAVGRYNIVTQATPTAVKAGDSITFNIGIVGTGPMELVQAPPLSELPTVLPNHSFHNHPQATAIGGGSS